MKFDLLMLNKFIRKSIQETKDALETVMNLSV